MKDFKVWQDDKCDLSNPTTVDYTKYHVASIEFDDSSQNGPMNTIFQMTIGMSSAKKSIVIKSYKVLDLMEDIGGILGAFQMVLTLVGNYLSSRLFKADVIRSMFK